ncbi:MAG: hypothetical protein OXG35_18230, partial [Acidobacteria bacterium]|nr:hypothetical protein [Acidobacteriota bacterium]
MLAGLRHDRLVGGDDEEHAVDAARAGQHVLDEALVAGHVHERQPGVAVAPVRESEIDGDPARLLLLQPIRIGAGQGPDESALAVVDVSGGADDDVAGHGVSPAPGHAAASVPPETPTTAGRGSRGRGAARGSVRRRGPRRESPPGR